MAQSGNHLPKGLRYSLNFLSIFAVPFILLGVIGAVLLAATTVIIRDWDDYQNYFVFLGIVLLLFTTGRSLLLLAEFIRRNHTQSLTENLVQKFCLLVLKEITFMIAYVLGVGTVINVLSILMGYSRDCVLFLTFFTLPSIIAIFINSRISRKMKYFEDEPIAY